MMMVCKTRVKPFDVLILNRIACLTSEDCAIHLVDECQVKKKEGDLQLTKEPSPEGKL